jgi:hypothetical protein
MMALIRFILKTSGIDRPSNIAGLSLEKTGIYGSSLAAERSFSEAAFTTLRRVYLRLQPSRNSSLELVSTYRRKLSPARYEIQAVCLSFLEWMVWFSETCVPKRIASKNF